MGSIARAVAWAVAAVAVAGACSGPGTGEDTGTTSPTAPPAGSESVRSFTGRIEALGALVAVHVTAGTASAFVCAGTGQGPAYYFEAPVADAEAAELTSEDGGAVMALVVGADGASGTVTPAGGQPAPFSAPPAAGAAGLYVFTVGAEGEVLGRTPSGGRILGTVDDAHATFPDGTTTAPVALPGLAEGRWRGVVHEGALEACQLGGPGRYATATPSLAPPGG